MTPLFTQYEAGDVKHLIAQYPLAWVISPHASGAQNSLLPLIGKYDENGTLVKLIGHMAKTNPLHQIFKANANALILFQGPQGYISPEHAGLRNWGPTWNYASLQINAKITLSEQMTEFALDTLIEPCEQGRSQPWTPSELGGRYMNMLDAIIGFEAEITHINAIFKLGQDENEDTFKNIMETHPDSPLRDWMHRFNVKDKYHD